MSEVTVQQFVHIDVDGKDMFISREEAVSLRDGLIRELGSPITPIRPNPSPQPLPDTVYPVPSTIILGTNT